MIAIDWGTSSFRAYRLGSSGQILEARAAPQGILSVAKHEFTSVLEQQVGDWVLAGEAPIVMSGMVGSRQGWVEVPYVQCPAGLEQLSLHLKKVEWSQGEAWIVPGLSYIDASGVPDVMRGEETQLLGVLDELPAGEETLVCLPGTHSKWALVRDRRIESFRTYMTGEAFSVLRTHSLLGRMMEGDAPDERAFADGIARSDDPGGVLHHLFGVRTRGLFGELPAARASAYLSGLLIGHEMRSLEAASFRVLGSSSLASLYLRAAGLLGIDAAPFDPDAAAKGLFRLAAAIRAA